jgi:pilus assembly protein Flp/PilA
LPPAHRFSGKLRSILTFRFNPSSSQELMVPHAEPGAAAHNQNLEVNLKKVFSKFLSDESGATAIEYGLIAAGIALAIIAVVNGLGTNLNDKYTTINSSLK